MKDKELRKVLMRIYLDGNAHGKSAKDVLSLNWDFYVKSVKSAITVDELKKEVCFDCIHFIPGSNVCNQKSMTREGLSARENLLRKSTIVKSCLHCRHKKENHG